MSHWIMLPVYVNQQAVKLVMWHTIATERDVLHRPAKLCRNMPKWHIFSTFFIDIHWTCRYGCVMQNCTQECKYCKACCEEKLYFVILCALHFLGVAVHLWLAWRVMQSLQRIIFQWFTAKVLDLYLRSSLEFDLHFCGFYVHFS